VIPPPTKTLPPFPFPFFCPSINFLFFRYTLPLIAFPTLLSPHSYFGPPDKRRAKSVLCSGLFCVFCFVWVVFFFFFLLVVVFFFFFFWFVWVGCLSCCFFFLCNCRQPRFLSFRPFTLCFFFPHLPWHFPSSFFSIPCRWCTNSSPPLEVRSTFQGLNTPSNSWFTTFLVCFPMDYFSFLPPLSSLSPGPR